MTVPLYDYASRLLKLTADRMTTHSGLALPQTQYVGAGPMPVWDVDQYVVHLARMFTGAPGAENPVQGNGYQQRSAEFALSIVRTIPAPDDFGNPPSPAQMVPAVQQNMLDVAAIQDALEYIKDSGVWVDYNDTIGIGPTTSQGPEGVMLAAVGSIQIQVFDL